ncbi:hypothetical protein Mpop_2737 [Methylorubrum populi BJ001]|jgi:uncharacterized membrane protein YgaE (UPF0421/DUF939 family)|uniref:Uncharacterized protein n=1 Tax=Methylorubrum populi (strain ATCC BAA-705 / NCIMB 13946 / BJ001) TaxID=441620 RepID=B1ZD23_METPB|nr:hypothetical protein [Methylorubrum populi]ACB80892.1 hypothetical protein Mpop_2737 [Methylorubrum populi BJ001]
MSADLAKALKNVRNALSDAEHAVIEAELDLEEPSLDLEDAILSGRDEEIERLRRENLELRAIIRRQHQASQRKPGRAS